MMFWGIIRLAWTGHDRLGAVIIIGLMTVLGVWDFFQLRRQNGAAMGPAYIQQLGLCALVTLAIFNLRFDLWMASGYGISVAELHNRMPVWMVPVLTLVLLLWGVAMLLLTKPKVAGSNPI